MSTRGRKDQKKKNWFNENQLKERMYCAWIFESQGRGVYLHMKGYQVLCHSIF